MNKTKYQAIVIGVSAGGLTALEAILPKLPKDYKLPILIVQHISKDSPNYLVKHFDDKVPMRVKESSDKASIENSTIYFAPPDYHLMVEPDKTITLSVDEKVNYSRPAIDLLFQSAAEVYFDKLIGLILTGANSDGAEGLFKVKEMGGLTIVQSPETAEVDVMPKAAIDATEIDYILPLDEIGSFLASLG